MDGFYVVTGRVMKGSRVVGIKAYRLSDMKCGLIEWKRFSWFFKNCDVLNVVYKDSLVSLNKMLPIKSLWTFDESGNVIRQGMYTEADIVAICSKSIKISGALVSGAITDPDSEEANEYAESFYGNIRKRKDDVEKIARRINMPVATIDKIKHYLFLDEHMLGNEMQLFDPDAAIAQSWQRLCSPKMKLNPHDLTLIKHELLEMKYMDEGYSQHEAHIMASKVYDYDLEAKIYYDRLNKH